MTLNMNYTAALRNTALDAIDTAIGASGLLRIYDGAQPTDADTAVGAQNILAELPLSATAFGAASAGVMTAGAITDDSSANFTGTAAWGTLTTSGGTRVIDFTVGTTGTDMTIDSVSITIGQVVSCSSFVLTGGNA